MFKRVLFIDDELDIWHGALRDELCEFGFDVRGESDPAKAMEAVKTVRPDVVLLDILFPEGYCGKHILERIKQKYPHMPVMMITSTMDKSEYKAEDFLQADYRYAKLALAKGDFSDLAAKLDMIIDKADIEKQEIANDGGMSTYGFIVGKSKAMREVAEMVRKVAELDHTVLVTGESGTGKELIARSIHMQGHRRNKKFVTIVCAALPKGLLEGELFGYEKGAFTGAVNPKKGRLEIAGEGTIFLDEIGEIPLDTQVKLLRFLQERKFERIGGNTTLTSNARIIAATNKHLNELIQDGKFRRDLYFRLNVVSIHLPPLRERIDDILLFYEHFIQKANAGTGKKILTTCRDDVRELLTTYEWPGNVRELENIINSVVVIADENILQSDTFKKRFEQYQDTKIPFYNGAKMVDRLYSGKFTWNDMTKEFGPRGVARREILEQVIGKFIKAHGQRPTSKQLSGILGISPGNMRQVLCNNNIELKKFKG